MIRGIVENTIGEAVKTLKKDLSIGRKTGKISGVDWFDIDENLFDDNLYVYGIKVPTFDSVYAYEALETLHDYIDSLPDIACDFELKNLMERDSFDETWEAAIEQAEASVGDNDVAWIVRLSNIEKVGINESTKKLSEGAVHKIIEKHDLGLIDEIFA